ncbi:hypothetical protein [Ekhidna sp.]
MTNKLRATIAQILGGLILGATFIQSIHGIKESRNLILLQLDTTASIAREERALNRELSFQNNKLMISEINKNVEIAEADRSLAREDLNERIRLLDSTLKDNKAQRDLLAHQIRTQQIISNRQSNVLLFTEAVKLLGSDRAISRLGGVNSLRNLAVEDSLYTEVSLQLLLNLLKVENLEEKERTIIFWSALKVVNYLKEKSTTYYTFDDKRIMTDEGVFLGESNFGFTFEGLNLSNVRLSEIDASGLVFLNCDLSKSKIIGDFARTKFIHCNMDSTGIASIVEGKLGFDLERCYVSGRVSKVKFESVNFNKKETFNLLTRSNSLNTSSFSENDLIWDRSPFENLGSFKLYASIDGIRTLTDSHPMNWPGSLNFTYKDPHEVIWPASELGEILENRRNSTDVITQIINKEEECMELAFAYNVIAANCYQLLPENYAIEFNDKQDRN